ncbi:MAG TPA: c-type cytochrome, partial [Candidatus Angelobacter sp.]|nr:c-type cytochrome [Candidatus Angelobacter sp.]
ILLGLVATLAYLAGMRSAGKEGGEGATASASKSGGTVNVAALMKPTPELIAKGKALFLVNCASCHGNQGMGDGPAAAALNPKPRNFHEGYWKYGGGIARVVQTISTGSPGTAMAAFTSIPLEDRFAIAHYERSFAAKQEEDKPADLAWLGPTGDTSEHEGSAQGGTVGGPAKPTPTIPIEVALRLMAEPAPSVAPMGSVPPPSGEGRGAALYAERCASCHGASGEGGVRVRMLGSAPYAYVVTLPLSANRTGWMGVGGRFEKMVLEGIPGYMMPGNGDLSSEDVRALYDFVTSLRSRQGAAAQAPATPASRAATSARRPGGATRS